jgi:hypothetical protein
MVEASTRKGEIRRAGKFKLLGLHFYCIPCPDCNSERYDVNAGVSGVLHTRNQSSGLGIDARKLLTEAGCLSKLCISTLAYTESGIQN